MAFDAVICSRLYCIGQMVNTIDRTSPASRAGCDQCNTLGPPPLDKARLAHTMRVSPRTVWDEAGWPSAFDRQVPHGTRSANKENGSKWPSAHL